MQIPFELFIALRYLRARRRQATVSIITGIAITGIAVGVAALLLAVGLAAGFRRQVQDRILSGTAHLNLLKPDNSGIAEYRSLVEKLAAVPGIKAVGATMYDQVLLNANELQEPVILKGVDFSNPDRNSSELYSTMVEGSIEDLKKSDGEELEGIVLGRELARKLNLKPGDTVTAYSAKTRLTPAGPSPLNSSFRVTGISSSGLFEYDSHWAYVTLRAAQRLNGEGNVAGVIQLKVDDLYDVAAIAERVRGAVGPGYMTQTWQELNKSLFSAFKLQQYLIFVFFTLLIAMAALNIITSLTMAVIEKQGDIAILRAQGARAASISRIFIWQGMLTGVAGSILGVVIGILGAWIINHYRLISIPAEIYSISSINVEINVWNCLFIGGMAIALSLLATLYPARAASSVDPVAALRYE